MQGNEVALRDGQALAARSTTPEWSTEEKEIMKATIAKDLTDAEFKAFMYSAAMMRMNPLAKQIYPVKFEGRMSLVIGIDGFLDHANESGKYRGFTEPTLTIREGKEIKEISHRLYDPETHKVIAATVGVKHADDPEPTYVTATFAEYAVWFKDKTSNKEYLGKRWKNAPAGQLIKCARALAIRLRFPGMGGEIYVKEELGAIDVEFSAVGQKQLPPARPKKKQTVLAPEQPPQTETAPVEAEMVVETPHQAATDGEVVDAELNDAAEPAVEIEALLDQMTTYLKDTHRIQPGGLEYMEKLICTEFGVSKSFFVPLEKLEDLKKFGRGKMLQDLAQENWIPMKRTE